MKQLEPNAAFNPASLVLGVAPYLVSNQSDQKIDFYSLSDVLVYPPKSAILATELPERVYEAIVLASTEPIPVPDVLLHPPTPNPIVYPLVFPASEANLEPFS